MVSDDKIYRAGLKLGITTDTEDTSGETLTECADIPSRDAVFAACERFVGDIMQTPPMYSALKVDGKKLVDLARQGICIEREARPIHVHSIDVTPSASPSDYTLTVHCSKGTYIRTLCADIGSALGCGGTMSSLERLKSGNFRIEESHTIDELENLSFDERYSLLMPTESLFSELAEVKLSAFFEKLCRSGNEIYQKKIGCAYPIGTRVRISGADGFFALGEVREYESGSAIKAIKLFSL